jgi:hypothetical protein
VLIIENWTSNALQQQGITLSDGSVLQLEIYFREQQQGWFITSLTWSATGFTVTGLRVTNNINILQQWKNILPFGLACVTSDGVEPSNIQDFSSGNSVLYVLEIADLQALETALESAS